MELSDERLVGIGAAVEEQRNQIERRSLIGMIGSQLGAVAREEIRGCIPHLDGMVQRTIVGIRTEIFGLVEGVIQIPFEDEKIAWTPHLTFPNLASGERVGRRLTLGEREPILHATATLATALNYAGSV